MPKNTYGDGVEIATYEQKTQHLAEVRRRGRAERDRQDQLPTGLFVESRMRRLAEQVWRGLAVPHPCNTGSTVLALTDTPPDARTTIDGLVVSMRWARLVRSTFVDAFLSTTPVQDDDALPALPAS
ncbi:hypothetical protein ABT324_30895 [Saccharopolyspora sp. NPDC000359]|uniref:hypothetical protein n=1 Tax=Saccharopolyspora sp. NPDC000359 TaxID=3154251 RepID=UPI00331E829B